MTPTNASRKMLLAVTAFALLISASLLHYAVENPGPQKQMSSTTARAPNAPQVPNEQTQAVRVALDAKFTPSSPVLIYLRTRDHIVAVHRSVGNQAGARVSVFGARGELLAEEMTGVEMQQRFPALYEQYRRSYAEAWAGQL